MRKAKETNLVENKPKCSSTIRPFIFYIEFVFIVFVFSLSLFMQVHMNVALFLRLLKEFFEANKCCVLQDVSFWGGSELE